MHMALDAAATSQGHVFVCACVCHVFVVCCLGNTHVCGCGYLSRNKDTVTSWHVYICIYIYNIHDAHQDISTYTSHRRAIQTQVHRHRHRYTDTDTDTDTVTDRHRHRRTFA